MFTVIVETQMVDHCSTRQRRLDDDHWVSGEVHVTGIMAVHCRKVKGVTAALWNDQNLTPSLSAAMMDRRLPGEAAQPVC